MSRLFSKVNRQSVVAVSHLQLVYFVGIDVDLPVPALSQEGVHLAPATVEVTVVYAKVAEHLYVLRLYPQLRVTKNHKEVIISHCLATLNHFKSFLVPQTQEQAKTRSTALRVDHLLRVGRNVLTEDSSDYNKYVLALVDVFVRIRAVERIVTVQQQALLYRTHERLQRLNQVSPFLPPALVKNRP